MNMCSHARYGTLGVTGSPTDMTLDMRPTVTDQDCSVHEASASMSYPEALRMNEQDNTDISWPADHTNA